MRCGASLPLAAAMLVAGTVACGRTSLTDEPAGTPGDASVRDVGPDANHRHVDAMADSHAADHAATTDSALDASPSVDAAHDGPGANTDASTSDARDANDAGDASDAHGARDAAEHLACDECNRGDQQCGPLPQVCTYNDAGVILSCEVPGQSIWTCVAGDAGCAGWAKGLACSSDVPCCVPCMYEFNCAVGSLGDPCEQDTDCAFDACDALTHQCVSDQCRDYRQDGQETDVDCGGPICDSCLVGQRCQSNLDCQSGHLCGSSHVCE